MTLTKGKTLQESATILLKKAPSADVAKAVPINVNKNTVFIVDTLAIGHLDDLKADELGTWHCTGVKSAYFRVKLMKAKKKKGFREKAKQKRSIQINPPLLHQCRSAVIEANHHNGSRS